MKRLAVILAALSTPAGVAAQTSCLTAREAESIVLVALPDVIRETGRVCTALPVNSVVRRTSGPFIAKYEAAADAAWPAARSAIAKLSDPSILLLLQSDYARPLITSLVAPQIVGRVTTSDCPTIDRLATLLEPLPARNTAGIVVATLQYLKAEKARGKAAVAELPDLPVCAVGR